MNSVKDILSDWQGSTAASAIVPDTHRYWSVLGTAIAETEDWAKPMSAVLHQYYERPGLIASEFYRHSSTEAIGAKTIAHVAENFAEPGLQVQMRRHAQDEIRHSKLFMALSRYHEREYTENLSPIIAENDDFIEQFAGEVEWFLCDTHIAELRNLVMLTLYVDAARGTGASTWVMKTLSKILIDERRHVSYTLPYVIRLIEADVANEAEFIETFRHYANISSHDVRRLSEFT